MSLFTTLEPFSSVRFVGCLRDVFEYKEGTHKQQYSAVSLTKNPTIRIWTSLQHVIFCKPYSHARYLKMAMSTV